MKLQEFVNLVKHSLEQFEDDWLGGNRQNPYQFPLEMYFADWWEQFETYDIEKKDIITEIDQT